jgi:hypothetical protein
MLVPTHYTISVAQLQEAVSSLPTIDSRLALNQPSGKFFTDPWEIKPEYQGTIWETILDSLKEPKGEARLIKLEQGVCYPSHADIDDRWHMSLTGNRSYLIDLENEQMYQTDDLGRWYSMNAGIRHSAANFGSGSRVQLVVRKLLNKPNITNPKQISITLKNIVGERRFIFDDVISPWLNQAYKLGIVSDFDGQDLKATMTIEESYIPELAEHVKDYFVLTVVD